MAINFQRGQSPMETIGIGKWHNAIAITHMVVHGIVGWKKNDGSITKSQVDYRFEGRDLKDYLKSIEDLDLLVGDKSEEIAKRYMRAVFFGTCIIRDGKCPVEEDELIAEVWDFTVFQLAEEFKAYSLNQFSGKNLSYEGDVYTIPEKELE